MRLCKLCDLNTVCTEFHAIMECTNPTIIELWHKLNENIKLLHIQWNSISAKSKFVYLNLSSDRNCTFYYSLFLDKIFREHQT